ncbi:TetR family transcriptional regulator [Emcibacter sp. SYSU 3D8]|uniref:TetR/AcrR family transcriptional regulator n=1 Tax=Emcibacter sp. SYSU 3D8 TaxID=3133969 RepID=UPI0031FEC16F
MTAARRKQSSPERILDAAERLFSRRGFYGASLRDIAKDAGVQMSLVNYHFGPKEDLFRQVVRRRADEHASAIAASLEALLERQERESVTVEDVIRALLTPIIDRYINGGEGWRDYIQLLSRASHQHHDANFIAPFVETYQPIMDQYTDEFLSLFPKADKPDVFWSIVFLEAALANILLQSTLAERVSQGAFTATDLDTVLERMVRFFGAGFREIARP